MKYMVRGSAKKCRPQAFEHFDAQMPRLEQGEGLLHSAIAISMHDLEDVEPKSVQRQLDRLSDRVRGRVRSDSAAALVAHLHAVLFDEEGLVGNRKNYYDPMNSYISAVLETKRGLPITLSLIYKYIAERLGLRVVGINAPFHFMAAVEIDGSIMMVDPFAAGRKVSPQEAIDSIQEVSGLSAAKPEQYLHPSTHEQWISRMLLNLESVFHLSGRTDDLAAMGELRSVLARERRSD